MGTFFNTQHNSFFYLSLTACITLLIRSVIAVDGCQPPSQSIPGFDMSLYHYPYNTTNGLRYCFNDEYQHPDFQQGGYEYYGGGLFGQASNIFDVNLEIRLQEMCTPTLGNLPANFNYGETFTISNFTMLLTGYFLAEQSGQYTFKLVADDLAYLSLGAGNAFECCREAGTVNKPTKFDLIVIWNGADQMSGSVSYDLQAGVYYPIRLLYANRDYHGDLQLSFQDPSGNVHTSFTDYIYQFPDNTQGCAMQITTTTRPGTVTQSTTVATSTHTVTGSDGLVTIETIYIIETPSTKSIEESTTIEGDIPYEGVETATTTFTPGTAGITTTLSTSTSVITGSDGSVTTETIYIVETPSSTPSVETATTTFTPGTANTVTTYSTATNIFTGSDGTVTTETIYYVETPILQTISTIVTRTVQDFTITSRTTIETIVNTFKTGSNGNVVEMTSAESYVAIPETISMITQRSSIRRSSTLAGQFRYPTKTASSTAAAGISQYQGNGVNLSEKMYSFVFGLCFSLLFL